MINKKLIYSILMLISAVLLLGSIGAVENNLIPIWQGCWQIICAIILGLVAWKLYELEETGAARRRKR